MIADLEWMKKLTHGAVKITAGEEGFQFYRFTEQQIGGNVRCEPDPAGWVSLQRARAENVASGKRNLRFDGCGQPDV